MYTYQTKNVAVRSTYFGYRRDDGNAVKSYLRARNSRERPNLIVVLSHSVDISDLRLTEYE